MSFVAIASTSYGLSVTIAPRVLSRYKEGGPSRNVDYGLGGQPIVTEWPLAPTAPERPRLVLHFAYLTAAQAESLDDVLNEGGLIYAKTTAAGVAIECMAAPRSEQKIEPFVGDYPDESSDGGAFAEPLTAWTAEITLIRLE